MGWKYETRAEIIIHAPPAAVWAQLVDFPAFDEWNPMLTEMEGAPEVGCKVRFAVATDGGGKMRMSGRVFEATPERRLEWRGGVPLVFIGHHYFELYAEGDGTRFVHGETFWGLGPLLMRGTLEKRAAPLYPALNEALKVRVEAAG